MTSTCINSCSVSENDLLTSFYFTDTDNEIIYNAPYGFIVILKLEKFFLAISVAMALVCLSAFSE